MFTISNPYSMDVSSLISARELLRRAEEHMSACNIVDAVEDIENETLRAMCEEMRDTCRSVWEVLNRILDENEEGKSNESSPSDVGLSFVHLHHIFYFYPSRQHARRPPREPTKSQTIE